MVSTVHVQLLSGDVIPVGGKESSRFGNLLHGRETPEGNLRLDLSRNLFRNGIHHFGGSESRRNGISGDVELGHLQRESFGEGDDAALASRVVGLAECFPVCPTTELILMIRPNLWLTMAGTAALVQ